MDGYVLVTAEQAGTYRVLAPGLRIQRPGRGDLVVNRPRSGDRRNGRFVDSDAEPTLVTLEEGERCDVAFLLKIGAIEPHTPPEKPAGKAKAGG